MVSQKVYRKTVDQKGINIMKQERVKFKQELFSKCIDFYHKKALLSY